MSSNGEIEVVSGRYHKSEITILKRVSLVEQYIYKNDNSVDLFITGGGDGNVILYEVDASHTLIRYLLTLDGLRGSVAALCGMLSGSKLIIVASWVDETTSGVRVWWLEYSDSKFSVSHFYDVTELGNAFVLASDMQKISNGRKLLAFGTTKRTIELYCESLCEKTIKPVLSIVGHEDWIHSLAFNQQSPTLLVTAGQDTQVKLWRIDAIIKSNDAAEISVFKNTFTIESLKPGQRSYNT
ncbi:unnamed protein product [Strongylus vulgaris]|uniref:Elongator complex protein 2 n=1 Tax=Strongylus vulgaris TaxID=40348 RepID=A0A3P7KCH4_STRVU|nr:unnamed protein product [Strongylus vulgaris]